MNVVDVFAFEIRRMRCTVKWIASYAALRNLASPTPPLAECGRKPQNFEFTPPNGFSDGLNSIEGFRPIANAPLQHSRALDAAACADR
ncbi:uncharacterized protein PpBr36_06572 [Pyricularia pennisetigena]|uniref:uncharacterized protein n=1 Tax=Pyricularia pennisetigena TaxID=1578925 RepID=UPI001151225F|nr:uncharacterized protein PpBr36_06572 [Pyricularia pennisetigena]TLS22995.1 hypothetical protein PpBr36_06572 [Pyricularia pennisetigena]